jgi:hypothetical protein
MVTHGQCAIQTRSALAYRLKSNDRRSSGGLAEVTTGLPATGQLGMKDSSKVMIESKV